MHYLSTAAAAAAAAAGADGFGVRPVAVANS